MFYQATIRILFGFSVTIANVIALFVLIKCKKMAFQIPTMTIILAITDVITEIMITAGGFNPHVMCQISFHTQIAVTYMTCFFITAMSGDRFFALCFPFQYRRLVTSGRVYYLTLALWASSVSFSLLTLLWLKTTTVTIQGDCNFETDIVGGMVSIQHISYII